jgi:hypothetical protein
MGIGIVNWLSTEVSTRGVYPLRAVLRLFPNPELADFNSFLTFEKWERPFFTWGLF